MTGKRKLAWLLVLVGLAVAAFSVKSYVIPAVARPSYQSYPWRSRPAGVPMKLMDCNERAPVADGYYFEYYYTQQPWSDDPVPIKSLGKSFAPHKVTWVEAKSGSTHPFHDRPILMTPCPGGDRQRIRQVVGEMSSGYSRSEIFVITWSDDDQQWYRQNASTWLNN